MVQAAGICVNQVSFLLNPRDLTSYTPCISLPPPSKFIGLSPLSPYYALIMRNIVPKGRVAEFQAYAAGEALEGCSG